MLVRDHAVRGSHSQAHMMCWFHSERSFASPFVSSPRQMSLLLELSSQYALVCTGSWVCTGSGRKQKVCETH